jgi:hypothetical protein
MDDRERKWCLLCGLAGAGGSSLWFTGGLRSSVLVVVVLGVGVRHCKRGRGQGVSRLVVFFSFPRLSYGRIMDGHSMAWRGHACHAIPMPSLLVGIMYVCMSRTVRYILHVCR